MTTPMMALMRLQAAEESDKDALRLAQSFGFRGRSVRGGEAFLRALVEKEETQ